jgi:hypothetical protein
MAIGRRRKTMSKARQWGIALCAIGIGAAGIAFGQDAATLTPKTENNISYISGGVGKDEQELANSIGRYGYNVQLVFAEQQTGAYLADVRVRLADAKGNVVLDALSDGPMFLAKVPPGRYRATAEVHGQTRMASVDASSGAKRVTMLWPATADKQGNETTTSTTQAR